MLQQTGADATWAPHLSCQYPTAGHPRPQAMVAALAGAPAGAAGAAAGDAAVHPVGGQHPSVWLHSSLGGTRCSAAG